MLHTLKILKIFTPFVNFIPPIAFVKKIRACVHFLTQRKLFLKIEKKLEINFKINKTGTGI